jgi:UDP-N-acetylmuramoyl-L-alanyl-D-glutamate--2,6-diaminopimelate ligase
VTTGTTLHELARVLQGARLLEGVSGPEDTTVTGVSHDSRTVRPGDLFVAWSGYETDGHDYLADARRSGAVAAVVERPVPEVALPQLVVADGRRAAALVADHLLGHPGRKLTLVGITGTNGKTTTALLLRSLLAGRPGGAATVGTLGLVGPDGRIRPGTGGLTTPDPVTLATWLAALLAEGVGAVSMEASSHALAQHRLDALRFQVAVFTNLSRDHLDYHGGMEAYRQAKLHLVELLAEGGTVVANAQDPAWAGLVDGGALTFGMDGVGDVQAANVLATPRGTRFTLLFKGDSRAVQLPLLGRFNVENALAAAAAALALGSSLEEVAQSLSAVSQIPGRMEVVVREPFTVLIDFAHTPDALENLLRGLSELSPRRLVVLFGAGGDRDRGKRRPMAEAVARYADRVFLTSDNPRSEDPEAILDDLEEGLGGVDRVREADRRVAIRQMIAEARDGDVMVLAGKGHETYQVLGTERHPFDERDEVRTAMTLRGAA